MEVPPLDSSEAMTYAAGHGTTPASTISNGRPLQKLIIHTAAAHVATD